MSFHRRFAATKGTLAAVLQAMPDIPEPAKVFLIAAATGVEKPDDTVLVVTAIGHLAQPGNQGSSNADLRVEAFELTPPPQTANQQGAAV